MEIIQERLEREFDLDLIASAPSVEYHVTLTNGRGEVSVDNPARLPGPSDIEDIAEPWVKVSIITPVQVHRHAHGAGHQGRRGSHRRRGRTSTRSAS